MRKPHPSTDVLTNRAERYVGTMLSVLHDEDIVLDPQRFLLKMNVKLDWSKRRRRSYGGVIRIRSVLRPSISIALWPQIQRYKDGRYHEYPSVAARPDIGSTDLFAPEHGIMVVIAHEVSHAVQYCPEWVTSMIDQGILWPVKLPKNDRPHGKRFKYLYRLLRVGYVNSAIDMCRVRSMVADRS